MRAPLTIGVAALALALAWGGAWAAAPERSVAAWYGQRLAGVEWTGHGGLSAAALEAASGWRRGAAFDSTMWATLAARVTARYAEAGYLEARVAQVRLVPEGDGVAARVEIAEGPRHRFGTILVHGGGAEEEVRAALGLAAGEPWSAARLEQSLAGLVESYRAQGRPHSRVHLRRVWTEGDLAHCEIVILESDTVWVDSVRAEGLTATSPGLVRRVAEDVAGKPYDPEAAEALRRRLEDLRIFSRVDGPRLESGSSRRAVLVYAVEERPANSATGVLGFQGKDAGPAGLAELALGNIGGSARQLELAWQGRGDAGSIFHLQYGEPLLPFVGARAAVRVDHELYDTTFVRTRGQLEIGTPGGRGWDAAAGLAVERVVLEGDARSDRRELSARGGTGRVAESGAGAVARGRRVEARGAWARTRDTAGDGSETSGSLWSAEARTLLAGGAGGSRHGSLALDARLRSGGGRPVELADRYPLGGVETLRGYREDAYRSDRYLLLRSELGFGGGATRPFVLLDQALFADPGSSGSTGERVTRYRVGYGAGLTQGTRAGRLGLVLAWGEGTGPLDAKLHLAFSTRF